MRARISGTAVALAVVAFASLAAVALAAAAPAEAGFAPGCGVAAPASTGSPTPTAAPSPSTASTPTAAPRPHLTAISATSGHVAASRRVVLSGTHLESVRAVVLGTRRLTGRCFAAGTRISVVVPQAPRFRPGSLRVSLRTASGTTVPTSVRFTYRVSGFRDRELAYALATLHKRGTSTYRYFGNEDCANFASQSLEAGGARTTTRWAPYTSAWVSSTALRRFLLTSHRATEVADARRDRVRLGDLVQFDWDRTGDRDHTGIVSKVWRDVAGRIRIAYVAHTDPGDGPVEDRDVDWSRTHHPGTTRAHPGRVFYLRLT